MNGYAIEVSTFRHVSTHEVFHFVTARACDRRTDEQMARATATYPGIGPEYVFLSKRIEADGLSQDDAAGAKLSLLSYWNYAGIKHLNTRNKDFRAAA